MLPVSTSGLTESELESCDSTFKVRASDCAPSLINNGLEPLQRQTITDVTENQDILGGSQEVVEFSMKIVGLGTVLQSILEVALLIAISYGIQRANSTTKTTKPKIPNLEQAIFVIVVVGPLIPGG